VTTLLYVLVGSVAVLTVSPTELAASDAPLSLVFERSGGSAALLGIIAMFALLNGALIQVIKASRVLFSLAGQYGVPAAFGRVNSRTRTPLIATAFSSIFAAALAASLSLDTLAEATSLVTLTTFALANLALLRVKRRDPRPSGVRVYPAWIPLVGFLSTTGLIVLDVANRIAAH
jgi:amino acid transporter